VDLTDVRHATDAQLAARLHPRYAGPLARVEGGDVAYRGLPFRLARASGRRWLLIDRRVELPVPDASATSLVLLAFCDAWRDEQGERPTGTPVGWVLPVGEPLASVTVGFRDAPSTTIVLRRRYEVNEGIIGWGSMAFLALPHRVEHPIDALGPHPRQVPGRYAPVGHAGPMTTLPGGSGARQPGVEDHVPSATDELMLWLHAIDLGTGGTPAVVRSVTFEPLPGDGTGRDVVVAALTTFMGTASPVRWRPRTAYRVDDAVGVPIGVDLGLVARRRPLGPRPDAAGQDPGLPGPAAEDGRPLPELTGAEELELTAAPDATLTIDGDRVTLPGPGRDVRAAGSGVRIEALPPADRRMFVEVTTSGGERLAARVAFRARDGRVLAPLGHADTVNPGLLEDVGADLLLGGRTWAYVDGTFEIDLPGDGAVAEVMAGPDRPGTRLDIAPPDLDRGSLRVTLGDAVVPSSGTWVSGDTHVHFLSPATALVQARAEGVNAVHLLATQWGDLVTSLLDHDGDLVHAGGRHAVWVGSENRQNMLGHVGLVGGAPKLPFASGGPPEGRIGDPVRLAMADWLRRCRAEGGLAIGAHFPLPMAEVAADIAAGLLDAVEVQVFDPTLESPPLREWYRYLDAGFRLPLVGGTDRMSAEVPLGQVRTWARLDDAELSFETWARAIRAGRTFVTSGPILELRVEGREPGDDLRVDAGARVELEAIARSARPIIGALEIVLDGRVVASCVPEAPGAEVRLAERVAIERSGWLAARSRSPYAWPSGFATSMAAHTSPVWIEVPGRPRPRADLRTPLALVDGTRAWLETLAPIADERDLARFRELLTDAERELRAR
jgi:hypothetical protein